MNKRAPKLRELAIMVLFAFSCFAILLYLWKTFGGPGPIAAKQYQVQADFDEATQLSDTADVRISAGIDASRNTRASSSLASTSSPSCTSADARLNAIDDVGRSEYARRKRSAAASYSPRLASATPSWKRARAVAAV